MLEKCLKNIVMCSLCTMESWELASRLISEGIIKEIDIAISEEILGGSLVVSPEKLLKKSLDKFFGTIFEGMEEILNNL